EELQTYAKKVIDSCGQLPTEAVTLLNSGRIKWIATQAGIAKLLLKQNKMICYFVADQQSDYYKSEQFGKILQFVQLYPKLGELKEKNTKNGLRLMYTFDHIKSVDKALEILQKLQRL